MLTGILVLQGQRCGGDKKVNTMPDMFLVLSGLLLVYLPMVDYYYFVKK